MSIGVARTMWEIPPSPGGDVPVDAGNLEAVHAEPGAMMFVGQLLV
jgi:hypothetical protein